MPGNFPMDHWTCSSCGKNTFYEKGTSNINFRCESCGSNIPFTSLVRLFRENHHLTPQQAEHQAKRLLHIEITSSSPSTTTFGSGWRDVTLGTANGQDVKLSYDKRTQGIALIGKNGTGKSSLIHAILNQELQGAGIDATLLLFDPHGDLARDVLKSGRNARKQVLWITPETTTPFGLNLLEADTKDIYAVERVTDVTLQIFRRLISKDQTYLPRFENILFNGIKTLILANNGYTLAEFPIILTDKQFRQNAIRYIDNPAIRQFWQDYEIIAKRDFERVQYVESVANRLSMLLGNELIYRIISHSRSTIRFSELIESGNALLFSLPMGRLNESATSLLGSILLAKFAEAIYSRGKGKRRVHLYIDEYGRYFSTPFTADLLTQGRKYNVSTLVTMQTLQQLPDEQNTAAVLNVGNLMVFATIGKDSDILSRQFPLPAALPQTPDVTAPYMLSPTPVQDIWKKPHPSREVTELRNSLLILLHRLETEPYEKVFTSPMLMKEEAQDLREKFSDMESYCSSREQITEGFNKLNEFLLLCQGGDASNVWNSQDWKSLLFTVLLLFRGYFGIYPQNHKDTEGDYAEWLHQRAKRNLVDPRQLAKDYEWIAQKIPEREVSPLLDIFLSFLQQDKSSDNENLMNYAFQRQKTILHTYFDEFRLFNQEYFSLSHEERVSVCTDRAMFEINNFVLWIGVLVQAAIALRKSPVVTQASTYAGGRTWERGMGDMREELSMRLATLPSYTAMCQLIQSDGSTQTALIRCLKG